MQIILRAVAALALAIPLAPASAQEADTAYLAAPLNLPADDVVAVSQVIARLNHALDAADYALYGSYFAEDGVFNSDFGDATGPEEIAAAMTEVGPFITNRRHVAANLVVSGEGDRAVVTSYLVVFERAESLSYVGSALNTDTLERRDGRWVVVRHDSVLDPATQAAMQQATGSGGN